LEVGRKEIGELTYSEAVQHVPYRLVSADTDTRVWIEIIGALLLFCLGPVCLKQWVRVSVTQGSTSAAAKKSSKWAGEKSENSHTPRQCSTCPIAFYLQTRKPDQGLKSFYANCWNKEENEQWCLGLVW
jgi:hypothetical protein